MVLDANYHDARFRPAPLGFEAGTPPIASVIGLGATLGMIANKSQKASGGDLARECINATLSGIERLGLELDDQAFD